ncbi:hypothetical protein AZE42_11637 [Rhizopogon vesiculosus]|uniref:Uncharacterized protein n=1 Tax=Rhizopogon vesiculosus TaxID=180088 RepID=A0A1J8QB37_9AGAM|nr:hypothetical protein AZE42_11637 [Rhizopogon vesiculosus]
MVTTTTLEYKSQHRSTPTTALVSMSSSWLDIVEQHVSSTNDGHEPSNQDSTRSTLQSFLEFLNQHYHHDGVNNTYKEIIRICITEMLASCQSEASTVDEGICHSSADLQEMFEFEHLQGQLSDQEYGPLFQESVNTLQEGEDPPFRQLAPGPLLSHLSGSVSYDPGTQPSQSFVPEMGTRPEGRVFFGSSVSRHQQLRLPVVQGGQEKVR